MRYGIKTYTFRTPKASLLPPTTKSCKNYFARRVNMEQNLFFFLSGGENAHIGEEYEISVFWINVLRAGDWWNVKSSDSISHQVQVWTIRWCQSSTQKRVSSRHSSSLRLWNITGSTNHAQNVQKENNNRLQDHSEFAMRDWFRQWNLNAQRRVPPTCPSRVV